MNRKNYEKNITDGTFAIFNNNLLNRIKLIMGDLKKWTETLKNTEIAKALNSKDLKKEVQFVVDYMAENLDKYSKEMYYSKMFKDRIPIYDKEINIKEIITDSLDLISTISDKWDFAEKLEVCTLIAQLRDNLIKIKLIVIALQGYFDKIDTYLDYYFQLQEKVTAVSDYVQEILEEYSKENHCIVL